MIAIAIPQITHGTVTLITPITVETMQEALSKVGNYTIKEVDKMDNNTENKASSSCCGGSKEN